MIHDLTESQIGGSLTLVTEHPFGSAQDVAAKGGSDSCGLRVEGNKILDETGDPVRFRGVSLIDLGVQQRWYGGYMWALDMITSPGWYPNTVRLPVYPPQVGAYRSPYPYPFRDEGNQRYYIDLLKPAVDYATAKGLYVIIDFHQIADTDGVFCDQALEFWEFIAPKFSDRPNVLYEIFNEPIDDISRDAVTKWRPFRERAQRWVDSVRNLAPDNLILIGGPTWAQVIGPVLEEPVEGKNIAYTVHVYPACWNSWVEEEVSRVAKEYPVVLTEFGFGAGDEWFGPKIRTLIEENHLHSVAWVLSHDWGPPMIRDRFTRELTTFGNFVKDLLSEI